MSTLLAFIRRNPDNWRQLLTEKPYCLTIKDDGPYTMLSYSQIDSDFNNEIVRECRGVIIKPVRHPADGQLYYDKVCSPFNKFGNYGESYCPEIDWESAIVEEKIDGSLIKLWYDEGMWHISTNNTIDAFKAKLGDMKYETFGDLFIDTLRNYFKSFDIFTGLLNKYYTYMFELATPYNQIVVNHDKPRIYFIGLKCNMFAWELDPLDEYIASVFDCPRRYNFHSFDETLAYVKTLPENNEGFVVVDKMFNRVKVKTEWYVQLHHLTNNGVMTRERMFHILQIHEEDEVLTYFPQYCEEFNRAKKFMSDIAQIADETFDDLNYIEDRKTYAEQVKKIPLLSSYLFWAYDHKGVASFANYTEKWGGREWAKLYEKFDKSGEI